jgi:hypothetical protein
MIAGPTIGVLRHAISERGCGRKGEIRKKPVGPSTETQAARLDFARMPRGIFW